MRLRVVPHLTEGCACRCIVVGGIIIVADGSDGHRFDQPPAYSRVERHPFGRRRGKGDSVSPITEHCNPRFHRELKIRLEWAFISIQLQHLEITAQGSELGGWIISHSETQMIQQDLV